MSSLRFTSAFLALTMGAVACTSGGSSANGSDEPVTDLDGDQIQLTSALVTVDSCDALLERIKDEAIERVGPYGFGQQFGVGPFDFIEVEAEDAMEEMEEAATDDSAADFAAAGDGMQAATRDASGESAAADQDAEFSETNNQEQGVDEADLVKTDGRRLVIVNGNRLEVIDVEQDEPRLLRTVKLPEEFYGGELFLNGDTALLMTSGWTDAPFFRGGATTDWYPGSPTGRIMEIDLESGSVERTLEFEGGYLSAREVDGAIRIVLSASESRFNFVFPSNPGAEDSAEEANRNLIEESTIDMWIPTFRITSGDEVVSEGPVVDCDRVHLPAEFAGFGSLVVLTADIDDGLSINDSLSVFTDASTVYASQDRLAVAAPRWPEWDEDGNPRAEDDYRTALHTFNISDARETSYVASGSVRGNLLNQYSMSEHDGYLRVATTDGTPWDSRNSESFVTVLREDGGELVEVGQVGGLGEGEQIFAVRFMGDKGYVVTFEQIDPLYTLDLSDPADPQVLGELKIPGVSEYLHPYGDDYLLAVGTDGDENGLTWGSVVSVFDVSDPSNPTQVDKLPLSPELGDGAQESGSWSPVSGDARAFNIWGDVMIVPVGWWSYTENDGIFSEENGSAAVLIKVDEDGTLRRIGSVSHPTTRECENGDVVLDGDQITVDVETSDSEDAEITDDEETDAESSFVREDPPADEVVPAPSIGEPENFCYTYVPQVTRTVIIGDNLYSISDGGVAVNEFDGLDAVAWIPFERF